MTEALAVLDVLEGGIHSFRSEEHRARRARQGGHGPSTAQGRNELRKELPVSFTKHLADIASIISQRKSQFGDGLTLHFC